MELSIVIPVFNEAESLNPLQEELKQPLKDIGCEYEIIYVDDASSDSSLEVLKTIAKEHDRIRIISFVSNRGQSAALQVGFKNARGEWIATLDADGQNPPSEIKCLWEARESFDFITGIRNKRKDSFVKRAGSVLARIFRRLVLGDTSKDVGCSLRIFRKEVVDTITLFNNFHRFFTFLVKIHGFSIKEVLVEHRGRKFGSSKYGNCKRLCQGIFDLWGVFWLKKRLISYEVKYQR